MEYSIDRTSYRRRTNIEADDSERKKLIYKIIKRLIIQSIAGIIVLVTACTIKAMKLQPMSDWLHEEINRDIPFETACAKIKGEIDKIYSKFVNTTKDASDIIQNEKVEDNVDNSSETESMESILSIHTEEPSEVVYEEAVEGINQMSEDAKFIKEKYKLMYPIHGTVTSRFGVRNSDNPIVTAYHSGIDLAANTGTKIYSSLAGKVITATTSESYGKYIIIETDEIRVLYAHCSKLKVKEGQKVKQGECIGEVGSTGWATGPHLHFEIRYNDRLVNPELILDFGE